MNRVFGAIVASTLMFSASDVLAADRPPIRVGFQVDLGAPDGLALGAVFSPVKDWAKVSGAFTFNGFTRGARAGFTFDPLKTFVAPTFTAELGFSGETNASRVVGHDVPRFTYEYINLHPGIEFGKRNGFRFFIRAGFTKLWAQAYGTQAAVGDPNVFVSDPTARLWLAPTFKVGFTAMVF